jgi:hypothetical protein
MNTRPHSTHGRFETLTRKEKLAICRLTRARTKQEEIARLLGRSVGAVQKWQRRLCGYTKPRLTPEAETEVVKLGEVFGYRAVAKMTGVPYRKVLEVFERRGINRKPGGQPRPFGTEVEKRIVALAAELHGYRSISRILNLGENRVRKFMAANGLSQNTGGQCLPKQKQDAIDAAIRGRKDFLCRIAKRFKVGTETVRRRAHKLLGPGKLLSVWPPLQSAFPQVPYEINRVQPDQYVTLVQRVLDKSFDGQFPFTPEYDQHFAGALLACFASFVPDFEGQPQPVLDRFGAGLREAVATLRTAQQSTWTN